MSSSWGNTINLRAESADMYGKVMSMADNEIVTYLTVCTRMPLQDVATLSSRLEGGENPRDIKMVLAREIVSMYHGSESAAEAEQTFIETFQDGHIPENVVEIQFPYIESLIEKNIVSSKTELRRLLDAGGVRNAETGEKLTELSTPIADSVVLKIGKRRFVKLCV
jgi:tyrosyl-tRNA synthetase